MNIENEILYSALHSRDQLYLLMDESSDLFDSTINRKVFNILKDMTDEGLDPSSAIIHARLIDMGVKKEDADKCILGILESKVSFSGISRLIIEKKKMNLKESIRNEALDLYKSIQEGRMSFDDMVDSVSRMGEKTQIRDMPTGISTHDLGDIPLDDLYGNDDYATSGIEELDNVIMGFPSGALVVIAARPGLGKSTLAMQMIFDSNKPAALISLEMPKKQVYARALSHYSDVELYKIRYKKMNGMEMERVLSARETIKSKSSVMLYDAKDFNDIIKILRRSPAGIFCVDYLQLIRKARKSGETRDQQISSITSEIKNIATERGSQVLLLSQLSRGHVHENRPPDLEDLRESGGIESDSDMVIFIWENKKSEYMDNDGKKKHPIYFIVAKNRDGRSDPMIPTYFKKEYYQFGNRYKPVTLGLFKDAETEGEL